MLTNNEHTSENGDNTYENCENGEKGMTKSKNGD